MSIVHQTNEFGFNDVYGTQTRPSSARLTRASRNFRPSVGDEITRDSTIFGDDVETVTPPVKEQPKIPAFMRLRQYSHLASFAMLGCWMRIRLEVSTVKGGLASLDAAIFPDLCGNILGTFVIGALTTASGIECGTRNVAIFPSNWDSVQKNTELQLGMRTGFCGSLTTFSSWNQAMVKLLLDRTNASAANAVFGYALGFFMSLSALPLGESIAAIFITYVHPEEDAGLPSIKEGIEEVGMGFKDRSGRGQWCASMKVKVWFMQLMNHVVVLAVAATLATLFAALPDDAELRKQFWVPTQGQCLAIIIAPFGAITRYELSKYNGMRKDFFVGTFAANLLACIVVSICAGFRADPGLSKFADTILYAIITGFGGCCSTVSTFMTDTIKLMPVSKSEAPIRAAFYVLTTVLICCAVSTGIYHFIEQAVS